MKVWLILRVLGAVSNSLSVGCIALDHSVRNVACDFIVPPWYPGHSTIFDP